MSRTVAPEREPQPSPPRRSRLAPVVAILLLAALAFTVSGVFPFRQLFHQRRQVEATREQLQQLVDQNDALAAEIETLQTDDEVERIAREQYGLVRPGESAYAVIVPDDGDTEEPIPAAEAAPSAPWWERLWNFVTGGDVADDG